VFGVMHYIVLALLGSGITKGFKSLKQKAKAIFLYKNKHDISNPKSGLIFLRPFKDISNPQFSPNWTDFYLMGLIVILKQGLTGYTESI